MIAHWVEWFGCPDSCNYPSVFCQTGRGAESTSIRLANVLALIHSFPSQTFLWFHEGQESTWACWLCPANSGRIIGNVSHFRFFYILWEMSGHLVYGQPFLSAHFPLKFTFGSCDDSEPLMCSTEVRPSNTSLLHYVCISVLRPSFMCLCGWRLRGQTVLVQNCGHSMQLQYTLLELFAKESSTFTIAHMG